MISKGWVRRLMTIVMKNFHFVFVTTSQYVQTKMQFKDDSAYHLRKLYSNQLR